MSQTPFKIDVSSRIARLPPYLFGRINKTKYEKRVAGIDIIDLGMGNPTDPTPPSVVAKLTEAAQDPRNHRYSVSNGIAGLRREVAKKYAAKYDVALDPETEVIATIGSKEGFSHLCLALLGPGDTVVVGDPAFPIHIYAPAMAGANVIRVPLGNDEAFLQRIERTIDGLYPPPKMLILNYPHNPTSMTVEPDFWDRAIEMCRRRNIMIISDFAYGEVCFDGYKAPSFLSAKGAKEVGVEFTTMSKSYNMAGWRCGFCCGNAEMVKALATIKGYYDYGMFAPVQIAGVIAMREYADFPAEQSKIYQHPPRRRLPRPGQARLDVRKTPRQHVRLGPHQARAPGRPGQHRLLPADDGRGRGGPVPRPGLRRERRRGRPHRHRRERAAAPPGDGQPDPRAQPPPVQAQAGAGRHGVRRRGRR